MHFYHRKEGEVSGKLVEEYSSTVVQYTKKHGFTSTTSSTTSHWTSANEKMASSSSSSSPSASAFASATFNEKK